MGAKAKIIRLFFSLNKDKVKRGENTASRKVKIIVLVADQEGFAHGHKTMVWRKDISRKDILKHIIDAIEEKPKP